MSGLEAVRRVIDVSRETEEHLTLYVERLRSWNERINLVSPADLAVIWDRHIADSAQLIQFHRAGAKWVDMGSGAGLPGLILAILMRDFGGGSIHLIESNRKKASFLLSLASELDLPVTVHAKRIEDVRVDHVDFVTARALAPLAKLLQYAEPWLIDGAAAIFPKGREYRAELAHCADDWEFALLLQESRTDSAAALLQFSNVRRKAR